MNKNCHIINITDIVIMCPPSLELPQDNTSKSLKKTYFHGGPVVQWSPKFIHVVDYSILLIWCSLKNNCKASYHCYFTNHCFFSQHGPEALMAMAFTRRLSVHPLLSS